MQLILIQQSDSRTKTPVTPTAPPTALSPGVLKLYVRIQAKVLLIPAGADKTVKWLTEEAARRYYNMTGIPFLLTFIINSQPNDYIFFSYAGLSPILSLQTDDGAALNEEDVVSLILKDGDKVVGEMVKWDLEPLPERYGKLCGQLNTGFI